MLSKSPFILSFLLLLSLPLLFVLVPRILPPKTLPSIPDPDEIDDLALFRRATLASAGGGGGGMGAGLRRRPASPPKIAFLFLTNSDFFFAPLWEKFFEGHGRLMNVYVHADPAARLHLPETPSFHGRFIPAKATQRASATLISVARRLLAAALLDDPANAFFALVSQHCLHHPPLPSAILRRPLLPSGRPQSPLRLARFMHHQSGFPLFSPSSALLRTIPPSPPSTATVPSPWPPLPPSSIVPKSTVGSQSPPPSSPVSTQTPAHSPFFSGKLPAARPSPAVSIISFTAAPQTALTAIFAF